MGIHIQINTPECSNVVPPLSLLQQKVMKILVTVSDLKMCVIVPVSVLLPFATVEITIQSSKYLLNPFSQFSPSQVMYSMWLSDTHHCCLGYSLNSCVVSCAEEKFPSVSWKDTENFPTITFSKI